MKRKLLLVLCLAALAGLFVIAAQGPPGGKSSPVAKQVPYTQVVDTVYDTPQSIRELKVIRESDVQVMFKNRARRPLASPYPSDASLAELTDQAIKAGVPVRVAPRPRTPFWQDLLGGLLPLALIFAAIWWLMRSNASLGKHFKSTVADQTAAPLVSFKDVAGAGPAMDEVRELVSFLNEPQRYARLGAKVPRGYLFVGPPGTGKTLMAKALAGESGAAFYSVSGSDFVEIFAGMGSKRIRELFTKAREHAPAIIFIDEIDAIGRSRSSNAAGAGNEEREQTLNQLLVEMDGFDGREAVIVIAATNRPDILDSALLRPGRFDRRITVEVPDLAGRLDILRVHGAGKPLEEGALERAAQQTPGFSGADLENLLNEAAIVATRRGGQSITDQDLTQALDRVVAGLERRSLSITEHERQLIAYHEVGHALCAHFSEHPQPVQRISAVSRGQALGYTMAVPEGDRVLESPGSLMSQLVMLMGGRAAELEVFGEASTGCQSDLQRASALARDMVTRFGMSQRIGLQYAAGPLSEGSLSPQTLALIDQEVAELVQRAQQQACAIVAQHRPQLECITARLREVETLQQQDFLALLESAQSAEAA